MIGSKTYTDAAPWRSLRRCCTAVAQLANAGVRPCYHPHWCCWRQPQLRPGSSKHRSTSTAGAETCSTIIQEQARGEGLCLCTAALARWADDFIGLLAHSWFAASVSWIWDNLVLTVYTYLDLLGALIQQCCGQHMLLWALQQPASEQQRTLRTIRSCAVQVDH